MSDSLQLNLFDADRHELTDASSIDPQVIAERGYRSMTRPTPNSQASRTELDALNIPHWATNEDRFFPGILIPMWDATGKQRCHQYKPRVPATNAEGKHMKYASTKGAPILLDVHPRWTRDRGQQDASLLPYILDVTAPLWITEGIKKADSLTSRGAVTIGLSGVWNWRNANGALGDWESVRVDGREVTICFDADAMDKPQILTAMKRLGQLLRARKAAKVWYLVTPGEVNGVVVKGADDYFAAGGTLEGLTAARTGVCPKPARDDTSFTEAVLAEQCAAECLEGRYISTAGLGWLEWVGDRWRTTEAEDVREAVRKWVLAKFAEATQEHQQRVQAGKANAASSLEMDGWYGTQSKNKLVNILDLAKGIEGVRHRADEFDTDPDILNTPGGVVDLATGEVRPHDPAMLLTKITGARYVPGARHPMWDAVLSALPDDVPDWLQLRMGAATTGHHDDQLIMFTGEGRNGKTSLMGTVFQTLGGLLPGKAGYADKVPNTLLLRQAQQGGANPEKMTLRGLRIAYIEETPEGGYLDAQVTKDLVDAKAVDARHLYKDLVTWAASHSIFLNTNFPPVVSETDNGTWRRLLRITFPYRYRKTHETLETPQDRRGIAGMATSLGDTCVQEAALAWLIEGAKTWYAGGCNSEAIEEPESVTEAVLAWRLESDDIMRFISDRLALVAQAWVASTEAYADYRAWAADNGARPMSSKEFRKRIETHSMLKSKVKFQQVDGVRNGLSRPSGGDVWLGGRSTLPARPLAILGLAFAA